MEQLTSHIMMVRPAHFGFNEQTAVNNSFQSKNESPDTDWLKNIARDEFDRMVQTLTSRGIRVMVVEDTADPVKPDAVFPNNWISFHEGGVVVTYPMFAPNRRIERREDIIDMVEKNYKVQNRYSLEFFENDDDPLILEGTGSMILDRPNGIVYACISQRTNPLLLDKFNVLLGTRSVLFKSVDRNGGEVYHTNVMMALGEDFVVICLESVPSARSKEELLASFKATGKEVVEISMSQMEAFAGNMLEVRSKDGTRYLCLSQTAYDSLDESQKSRLSDRTNLLPIAIPNIEKYGGGSVRCMMAEIFLEPKQKG
jgi:hypothetical protein